MRYDLSTHTNLTDEELIGLAQAGDELAFTELMSRYSRRLWKVITANSRQRRDAEEILMDVWRAVWETSADCGALRVLVDGCIALLTMLARGTTLLPTIQRAKFRIVMLT